MKKQQVIIPYAKVGNLPAVRRVLRQGADPNERDEKNWTPLHWASQEGFLDIVRCLIESGALVNVADDLGFTPLAMAAGHDHAAIVRELLKGGASASIRIHADGDGTALHLACSWKRTGVAKLLVELSDADINSKDADGKTPLAYAVEAGDKKLAAYLRKHGAII